MLAFSQSGGPAFRVATTASTVAELTAQLLRRQPRAKLPVIIIANGAALAATEALAPLLSKVGTTLRVVCGGDEPLFATDADVPPDMRLHAGLSDTAMTTADRILEAGMFEAAAPAAASPAAPPASLLVHEAVIGLRSAAGAPVTIQDLTTRVAPLVGVPDFALRLVVGGVDVLAGVADPRLPITTLPWPAAAAGAARVPASAGPKPPGSVLTTDVHVSLLGAAVARSVPREAPVVAAAPRAITATASAAVYEDPFSASDSGSPSTSAVPPTVATAPAIAVGPGVLTLPAGTPLAVAATILPGAIAGASGDGGEPCPSPAATGSEVMAAIRTVAPGHVSLGISLDSIFGNDARTGRLMPHDAVVVVRGSLPPSHGLPLAAITALTGAGASDGTGAGAGVSAAAGMIAAAPGTSPASAYTYRDMCRVRVLCGRCQTEGQAAWEWVCRGVEVMAPTSASSSSTPRFYSSDYDVPEEALIAHATARTGLSLGSTAPVLRLCPSRREAVEGSASDSAIGDMYVPLTAPATTAVAGGEAAATAAALSHRGSVLGAEAALMLQLLAILAPPQGEAAVESSV